MAGRSDQTKAAIRRTAWLLAAVAALIYLLFIFAGVSGYRMF